MKKHLLALGVLASALTSSASMATTCTDLNGTWYGTCERENIMPATITRTVMVDFDSTCSTVSITGFDIPSPGVNNLLVGKDLARFTEDSDSMGSILHFDQTVAVQWDAVNGVAVVPSSMSAVNYFGAFNFAGRSIGSNVLTMELNENGKLKGTTKIKTAVWFNGVEAEPLVAKEKCKLDPQ